MSEFMFCTHYGHLNAKVDKIAAKHGAWHTNHNDPALGPRGWFSCRNRGHPFDSAVAKAVMADIDAAGGLDAFRKKVTSPAAQRCR